MAHIDENPLGAHLPLDPLPGHSSLGRLERVLRRGFPRILETAEMQRQQQALAAQAQTGQLHQGFTRYLQRYTDQERQHNKLQYQEPFH